MAYLFINQTGIIGSIISSGTLTMTGTVVLSMIFIFLFLMVVALMFGIPLEFTGIIFLPLCIALASEFQQFYIALTAIIIYLSMVIAKNWLFR